MLNGRSVNGEHRACVIGIVGNVESVGRVVALDGSRLAVRTEFNGLFGISVFAVVVVIGDDSAVIGTLESDLVVAHVEDNVVATRGDNGSAPHNADNIFGLIVGNSVVAVAIVLVVKENVGAVAADEAVGACATNEGIITVAAVEGVVTAFAVNVIVSRFACVFVRDIIAIPFSHINSS